MQVLHRKNARTHGQQLKCLTVIDEYTREALASTWRAAFATFESKTLGRQERRRVDIASETNLRRLGRTGCGISDLVAERPPSWRDSAGNPARATRCRHLRLPCSRRQTENA